MQLPEQVTALVRTGVTELRPLGSAITGDRWRARLADGREVFVKSRAGAPPGFFAAEAAGLRWLAEAAGPPVPEVLGQDDEVLVLPWLREEPAGTAAAERLGRELAGLHAHPAPGFGAEWPGWIGAAPLDNRPAAGWPAFYAERRISPYVRTLRDRGELTGEQAAVLDRLVGRVEAVAGPPEPPARLHGDLWSGNVLWAGGRAWLVDPAAHGGHRETDLAMLALFGAPGLPRLIGAYAEVRPLADGWEGRRPLHQLHPLLVHAVLFPAAGYLRSALDAAARYL
jgi:fructosamine-3-kinase